MNRKERVYSELKLLSSELTLDDLKNGFSGFDATEIGKNINIGRSNSSKELNQLVEEKRVVKVLGRPVLFFDRYKLEEILDIKLKDSQLEINSLEDIINPNNKKNQIIKQSVFDRFIGSSGSLEIAIKQSKAAIFYPPNGLHTLLIGPTGVGKTTFAEMMYNYAKEIGQLDNNARFTIFNCSEYAENPQLIIAQLFGYVKGAFTGADKDKAGLIETTNGGILLLDEIHRLSPQGQEMLFLLIDKNIYRRLGETDNERKANILLIGATTEDIHSTLLDTFLRRIPMIIKFPSLSERPLIERYQLIKQFFKDQSQRVQARIIVYKDVIKALLSYRCQGNIGQLKSDIQLLCARGFLDYKTYFKKNVEIDNSLLPEYIYDGLLNHQNKDNEIMGLLELENNKYFEFTSSGKEEFNFIDEYDMSEGLYKEISDRYYYYCENDYPEEKMRDKINVYIKEYLKKLYKKFNVGMDISESQELFKVVSLRVYSAVEEAITIAEHELKKKFSKKVRIALALHVSKLMERIAENKIISNEEINKIALNNPYEFNVAKIIKGILEERLKITIPKEEVGFIAMFLYAIDGDNSQQNKKIGVIILAHGRNTASSISEVVNTLLDTDHCRAIDMPLDESVEAALLRTTELVGQVDQGKGVLLLVDMGSLAAFAGIISKNTNINVSSIEMVSTPIAIEAVRKCLLPDMSLEQLIEDLQRTTPYIGRLVTENTKMKASINEPGIIITICMTGEGTAIKLAELLRSSIPIIDEYNIQLKPMNINEVTINNVNNIENVIVAVGSANPKLPNVPYIPIDEIVIGEGLKKVNNLIVSNLGLHIEERNNPVDHNYTVQILREYLSFLDPTKAYDVLNQSFNLAIKMLNVQYSQRLHIGYIIHTACMLERLLRKEPLTYENVKSIIDNKDKLYEAIKKSMFIIEEAFRVSIPDTEVGYIMDLIETQ
jgi:transcriptional regulatory protein LevR/transcriptional regulator with AAA-type ATPase domain